MYLPVISALTEVINVRRAGAQLSHYILLEFFMIMTRDKRYGVW